MNERVIDDENKNPKIKFLKDGVAGQRKEVELPSMGTMGHEEAAEKDKSRVAKS